MKLSPLLCALSLCLRAGAAEVPRALPPDTLPDDARLGPLKELDGYFPFTPPASREAWATRAEEVRMQMRVALGLWPEPTRTPLNAVVHGRIERDDYTVEKVFFESMPGFFVTGSLFRPRTPGPHPAVLCPHGHWKDARFTVRDDAAMKKELESGGEVLPESGRSIFQSIGVHLARMGIVALVYDMLGDSDSQQISHAIAHRFAKQRPEMNTREYWGLFSPQAETHAQNIMGLQTWNSIRALDFLISLPDVDAKRLGCTGASGGGTQTMMLAALDPRLAVACPAVMVSTAMQGGCTCENASLLRVGTGNIEIAALFAPKPQGITTAKDWTVEMPEKGFPELQALYALTGAKENVALWPMPHFPHNYNSVTRHEIYRWFNTHFRLGLPDERLVERDYPLLTREQLTVWDDAHPAPPGGGEFERKLLRWWRDDAEAQLGSSPEHFSEVAAPAWRAMIGWDSGHTTKVARKREFDAQGRTRTYRAAVQTYAAEDRICEIPAIALDPPMFGGTTVLWLGEQGKAALFDSSGVLREEICQMLEGGMRVVGVDLFGQGEFLPNGQPILTTRVSKNPREAAAFTFGYNRALFAQRVQDIRKVLQAFEGRRSLVALDGTGPLAAVALAFNLSVESAVVETGGFRFGELLDLRDPGFLPAGAKYGDLLGALAVAMQHRQAAPRLYLLGEGAKVPPVLEAACRSAGRPGLLHAADKRTDTSALVAWLLKTRQ